MTGQVKVKLLAGLLVVALLGSPFAGIAAAESYDGPAEITADELITDGEIEVTNSTQSVYVDC